MVLRPDEIANQSDISRDENFRSNVKSGLKTGAAIGIGAAGGLGSRILPFLSSYVPMDLAMKGINKVAPQVGAFLKKGQSMGLDLKSGLDYLKTQIKEPEEERNIIQKESPELHQFLDQHIKSGRNPIEAGALAQIDEKFKSVIKKLEKSHNTRWSSIIESIFGGGQTAQPQQAQQQRQPFQGPGINQQPQAGPGEQALKAIVQKINQKRDQR